MTDKTAKANVVPVRQRTQYTCMATSLMMCLKALGMADIDEDTVNRVMGARPMQGASWEQALASIQHFGFRGSLMVPATLRQIKEWTDAGKPVMIAWNPENRDWSHASVVFDIDEDENVYIADPNIPDPDETVRVVTKAEFYSRWFEKWPNYLVRRPALFIDREITADGRQMLASTRAKWNEGEVIALFEMAGNVGKEFRAISGPDRRASVLTAPLSAVEMASVIDEGGAYVLRGRTAEEISDKISSLRHEGHDVYGQSGQTAWALHEAGKKERRQMKDRQRSNRLKGLVPEGSRDLTDTEKARRTREWNERKERGEVGLPGAGRAGPHKDKNDYSRQDKHRKKDVEGSQDEKVELDRFEGALKEAVSADQRMRVASEARRATLRLEMMTRLARIESLAAEVVATDVVAAKAGTVGVFLRIMGSKVTQFDKKLEARGQSNTFRLGHYLNALHEAEKQLTRDRIDQGASDATSLTALKEALSRNFTSDFPPLKNVLKQIDAFINSGTLPKLAADESEDQDDLEKVTPDEPKTAAEEDERDTEEMPDELGNKTAAIPYGMYGNTKAVERACTGAINRLNKHAVSLVKQAYAKDEKVADFFVRHAKKSKSHSARVALSALKGMAPKVASENENREADDKTAARQYGMYGMPAKTVKVGLAVCSSIREKAGEIACDLHSRRASLHGNITTFFDEHARTAKCAASRVLLAGYPDVETKLASVVETDESVPPSGKTHKLSHAPFETPAAGSSFTVEVPATPKLASVKEWLAWDESELDD